MPEDQPAVRETIRWTEGGEQHEARWQSEADLPPPTRVSVVDDRTTANMAMGRIRQGDSLLYRSGDFQNARQLLSALGRRVQKRRSGPPPKTPLESFRAERQARAEEHAVLNRVLVVLNDRYEVELKRAPKISTACEHAWGPSGGQPTVVSLRELLGIIGADQWREKGVEVPGLKGKLHPHYGVFSPTRPEYPALIAQAPSPKDKRVFDLGTGTGVLGFLLLARGAREVIATDVESRAVVCARENAERLRVADRFRVEQTDLFPQGRADLVVFNPPWLPETPRTRTDRAVYDPGGEALARYLDGLRDHLNEGGEGWLLLSNLAELIGLRAPDELQGRFEKAGLRVAWTRSAKPRHPKAFDPDDPLHAVRSKETTTLYGLVPVTP